MLLPPKVNMSAGTPHEDTQSFAAVQCNDFSLFQEVLKKMRLTDDRIAHALNTTVPTQSFAGQIDATEKCKTLYKELLQSNSRRVSMIKKCIGEVSVAVEEQRKNRQADMDNINILKKLRKEQTKLRQMQSELSVEEIIMDQSLKVFHERCRQHYTEPKH